MSTSIDLNLSAAFAAVVDEGSFTAAGRKLDVPKSTVSRRVAQLEEELGVQLLRRTTRRQHLTEAGELYYARVAPALRQMESAQRDMVSAGAAPHGVLRLTAPADIGGTLAEVIRTYGEQYPNVRVVLHVSQARIDLVREGYDLAIRGGELRESALMRRTLVRTRNLLCASPGYLAARGVPRSVAELASHQCLIFGSNGRPTRWVLEGPDGESTVDVDGTFHANEPGALHQAALRDRGVALLPSIAVGADLASGRLCRVLPEVHRDSGGLYCVYPPDRFLAPKVRAFIDVARAVFDELSADGVAGTRA